MESTLEREVKKARHVLDGEKARSKEREAQELSKRKELEQDVLRKERELCDKTEEAILWKQSSEKVSKTNVEKIRLRMLSF